MTNSPKTLARIAGSVYLVMFVCAVFAMMVRSRIVETGDAAATVANIRQSETLFRLGFVSDLIQITCMLLAGLALYVLLRGVNQLAAAAMVTFVAVAVAIGCLNLLNQFTALTIATSQDYPRAFGQEGSDALTMLFAERQDHGYYISAVFWGLWLLPLGYLLFTSGYVPRVLGALLFVGGLAYLVDLLAVFLAPDLGAAVGTPLLAIGGIAELLLTAWLLVKTVNVPQRDGLAPAVTARSDTAVR